MSARDNILGRIRSALQGSPPVEPPPVPQVWPRGKASPEQLVEQFAGELAAVAGELVRCRSMIEAREKLAEMIERSGWRTLGAVDRPLCRELTADLPPDRLAWTRDGWQPTQMAELSAGLVAAEVLLADTGSCLVANHTAEERLICYLPPACVVIAKVEQLAEHMPAAWQEIAAKTAEQERRGEFVLITGPSRTADIEKILVLGVHGPKRLVVLLVG